MRAESRPRRTATPAPVEGNRLWGGLAFKRTPFALDLGEQREERGHDLRLDVAPDTSGPAPPARRAGQRRHPSAGRPCSSQARPSSSVGGLARSPSTVLCRRSASTAAASA